MRAIIATAFLAMTVGAPTVWAQQGEPASSAGCGAGSILFEGQARFSATLQRNFTRLFPSENVTADQVIASMNAVLAEDAVLQRYVIT